MTMPSIYKKDMIGSIWEKDFDYSGYGDYLKAKQQIQKAPAMTTISYDALILRLLQSDGKYFVRCVVEDWGEGAEVLSIAVRGPNGQIVRFEEDLEKFPTDDLIDKLRLLR